MPGSRLSNCDSKPASSGKMPTKREHVALRHSIEETRAQLDANRLRSGGVAATLSSLPKSLTDVQRQLPADTAVLAYFVGDGKHARAGC